jgi:hypothetical protein
VSASFTAEAGTMCSAFASIGLNQAASGNLGASGCAMPDGTVFEGYSLNTFGAGTLTVTVASSDFTPSISVRTPDRTEAASGEGTVTATVDRDTRYQIVVAAADKTGAYQITTSFQPDMLETCKAVRTLADSAQENGSINGDSCAATIPGSGDLQYYNFYTVQVSAAGVADITVASADFLPTLTPAARPAVPRHACSSNRARTRCRSSARCFRAGRTS